MPRKRKSTPRPPPLPPTRPDRPARSNSPTERARFPSSPPAFSSTPRSRKRRAMSPSETSRDTPAARDAPSPSRQPSTSRTVSSPKRRKRSKGKKAKKRDSPCNTPLPESDEEATSSLPTLRPTPDQSQYDPENPVDEANVSHDDALGAEESAFLHGLARPPQHAQPGQGVPPPGLPPPHLPLANGPEQAERPSIDSGAESDLTSPSSDVEFQSGRHGGKGRDRDQGNNDSDVEVSQFLVNAITSPQQVQGKGREATSRPGRLGSTSSHSDRTSPRLKPTFGPEQPLQASHTPPHSVDGKEQGERQGEEDSEEHKAVEQHEGLQQINDQACSKPASREKLSSDQNTQGIRADHIAAAASIDTETKTAPLVPEQAQHASASLADEGHTDSPVHDPPDPSIALPQARPRVVIDDDVARTESEVFGSDRETSHRAMSLQGSTIIPNVPPTSPENKLKITPEAADWPGTEKFPLPSPASQGQGSKLAASPNTGLTNGSEEGRVNTQFESKVSQHFATDEGVDSETDKVNQKPVPGSQIRATNLQHETKAGDVWLAQKGDGDEAKQAYSEEIRSEDDSCTDSKPKPRHDGPEFKPAASSTSDSPQLQSLSKESDTGLQTRLTRSDNVETQAKLYSEDADATAMKVACQADASAGNSAESQADNENVIATVDQSSIDDTHLANSEKPEDKFQQVQSADSGFSHDAASEPSEPSPDALIRGTVLQHPGLEDSSRASAHHVHFSDGAIPGLAPDQPLEYDRAILSEAHPSTPPETTSDYDLALQAENPEQEDSREMDEVDALLCAIPATPPGEYGDGTMASLSKVHVEGVKQPGSPQEQTAFAADETLQNDARTPHRTSEQNNSQVQPIRSGPQHVDSAPETQLRQPTDTVPSAQAEDGGDVTINLDKTSYTEPQDRLQRPQEAAVVDSGQRPEGDNTYSEELANSPVSQHDWPSNSDYRTTSPGAQGTVSEDEEYAEYLRAPKDAGRRTDEGENDDQTSSQATDSSHSSDVSAIEVSDDNSGDESLENQEQTEEESLHESEAEAATSGTRSVDQEVSSPRAAAKKHDYDEWSYRRSLLPLPQVPVQKVPDPPLRTSNAMGPLARAIAHQPQPGQPGSAMARVAAIGAQALRRPGSSTPDTTIANSSVLSWWPYTARSQPNTATSLGVKKHLSYGARPTLTSRTARTVRRHDFAEARKRRQRLEAEKRFQNSRQLLGLLKQFQPRRQWESRSHRNAVEAILKGAQVLRSIDEAPAAPTPAGLGPRLKQRTDEYYQWKAAQHFLQRERDAMSTVGPSAAKLSEYLRLRRERAIRERKLRGILGRKPFPDRMTDVQEKFVQDAFKRRDLNVTIPGAQVTSQDIAKLRPRQWLNDESINFYGALIMQRSQRAVEKRKEALATGAPKVPMELRAYWDVHYFNSFFYGKISTQGHKGVARWTRRVDVFTKDKLIFPVNLGNSHWVAGCVDMRHRRIEYYDSMHTPNPHFFLHMRGWLSTEHEVKRGSPLDFDALGWTHYTNPCFPYQDNGYDCGVFAIAAMEQLSRRDPYLPFPAPYGKREGCDFPPDQPRPDGQDEDEDMEFNFTGKNMPYLRRRFVYELLNKKLLDTC